MKNSILPAEGIAYFELDRIRLETKITNRNFSFQ